MQFGAVYQERVTCHLFLEHFTKKISFPFNEAEKKGKIGYSFATAIWIFGRKMLRTPSSPLHRLNSKTASPRIFAVRLRLADRVQIATEADL